MCLRHLIFSVLEPISPYICSFIFLYFHTCQKSLLALYPLLPLTSNPWPSVLHAKFISDFFHLSQLYYIYFNLSLCYLLHLNHLNHLVTEPSASISHLRQFILTTVKVLLKIARQIMVLLDLKLLNVPTAPRKLPSLRIRPCHFCLHSTMKLFLTFSFFKEPSPSLPQGLCTQIFPFLKGSFHNLLY